MQVDYIILGQGICGTFVSWYLLKEGKKILVIDAQTPYTASLLASGVINPVTGRRIVKTWLIDELMPFAWQAYSAISKELNTAIIRQCNVLNFHPSPQMQQAFAKRMEEEKSCLKPQENEEAWKQYFDFYYGIGEINPCWLIDIQTLLQSWRKKLGNQHLLLEENFEWSNCRINHDCIRYKHITANKIICCEGAAGFYNPYFKLLPYALNKGEALIADIPGLPHTNIYKQGLSIVPWQNNLFWIGSSYDWQYDDLKPTDAFRKKTKAQLRLWLKLPYTILDHIAAERPANIERRPFVGTHPLHQNLAILNGMGTKGCSLAPYFAKQLIQYLLTNSPIHPLADVKRFAGILSK